MNGIINQMMNRIYVNKSTRIVYNSLIKVVHGKYYLYSPYINHYIHCVFTFINYLNKYTYKYNNIV